jgi:hypothetical protein
MAPTGGDDYRPSTRRSCFLVKVVLLLVYPWVWFLAWALWVAVGPWGSLLTVLLGTVALLITQVGVLNERGFRYRLLDGPTPVSRVVGGPIRPLRGATWCLELTSDRPAVATWCEITLDEERAAGRMLASAFGGYLLWEGGRLAYCSHVVVPAPAGRIDEGGDG